MLHSQLEDDLDQPQKDYLPKRSGAQRAAVDHMSGLIATILPSISFRREQFTVIEPTTGAIIRTKPSNFE